MLERKASGTKKKKKKKKCVVGGPKPPGVPHESNGAGQITVHGVARFTVRGPRDQRVPLNVVEIKDFSGTVGSWHH